MDPLHQFCIQKIIPLYLWGIDISFSNSSLSMLISVLTITSLFFCTTRKQSLIPSKAQAIGELAYTAVKYMISSNSSKEGLRYMPFVFSVFSFILAGNVLGMVPYNFTYTSHIIVTFGMAIIVFLFVTVLGFVRHGLKFFNLFVPKGVPFIVVPIVVPIEMISYLSKPISLSVRLFANMMAGHTMMKIFAGFCTSLGLFAFMPLAINVILTGFEIIVSCLQAYIFSILTCLYLHDAIHLH